jgi:hypothetical protein
MQNKMDVNDEIFRKKVYLYNCTVTGYGTHWKAY